MPFKFRKIFRSVYASSFLRRVPFLPSFLPHASFLTSSRFFPYFLPPYLLPILPIHLLPSLTFPFLSFLSSALRLQPNFHPPPQPSFPPSCQSTFMPNSITSFLPSSFPPSITISTVASNSSIYFLSSTL